MDLQKITNECGEFVQFTPITRTVNRDRRYFRNHEFFLKEDSLVSRGVNEAHTLDLLKSEVFSPHLISGQIVRDKHYLVTTIAPGDTLENLCKDAQLTKTDFLTIGKQLIYIVYRLTSIGICHNDINESNVMYCPEKRKVTLIDWECATLDMEKGDIYGMPYGLPYILEFLNDNGANK
jgi:serine/threonine protein kinase